MPWIIPLESSTGKIFLLECAITLTRSPNVLSTPIEAKSFSISSSVFNSVSTAISESWVNRLPCFAIRFEIFSKVDELIKNGANYANGKAIPEWVFEKKLYVREINKTTGNITISTALKGAITGVVKASDLAYYTETNPGNKVSTFVPYLIKVSVDILNVRSGPGTGYRISTQVKKNQVYTIIDEKNGWGKLKSGAGWISLQYTRKI